MGFLLAATGLLSALSMVIGAAGPSIHLDVFATAFNNPIGIDFFEPTVGSGQLIVTANSPTGLPNNVDLIDSAGTHTPFSPLAGMIDEIKIATVRDGLCTGGFAPGVAFLGNGTPGEIAKINLGAGSMFALTGSMFVY
jgi:hypothetical protein